MMVSRSRFVTENAHRIDAQYFYFLFILLNLGNMIYAASGCDRWYD